MTGEIAALKPTQSSRSYVHFHGIIVDNDSLFVASSTTWATILARTEGEEANIMLKTFTPPKKAR